MNVAAVIVIVKGRVVVRQIDDELCDVPNLADEADGGLGKDVGNSAPSAAVPSRIR